MHLHLLEAGSADVVDVVVEMLLYVHRNRRFIRDGSPQRLPRLSHEVLKASFNIYSWRFGEIFIKASLLFAVVGLGNS